VTADEVQAGERRAARQEATLLAWWAMQDAAVPGVRFTPSQVWEKLFERRVPLTSVRRAITNCTARGDLQHWPGDRVEGPFGAKEGRWSLSLSSPSEHANQRETLG
jgi:hypothetical protein